MDGLPYIISSYYYLPISISNDTLCLPTFSHCALCFLGQTFHWFLAKMPLFQREAALSFPASSAFPLWITPDSQKHVGITISHSFFPFATQRSYLNHTCLAK
jgi:hypothetical protein